MRSLICLFLLLMGVQSATAQKFDTVPGTKPVPASKPKGPPVPNGEPIPDRFILTWRGTNAELADYLQELEGYGYKEIDRCNCKPVRVLLDGEDAKITIDGLANGQGAKVRSGPSGGDVKSTLIPDIGLTLPDFRGVTMDAAILKGKVSTRISDPTIYPTKVLIAILDGPTTPDKYGAPPEVEWTEDDRRDESNPARERRASPDCPAVVPSDSREKFNHGDFVAMTLLEQMSLFKDSNEPQSLVQPFPTYLELVSFPILQTNGQGNLFKAICALEQASGLGVDAIVASWGFPLPEFAREAWELRSRLDFFNKRRDGKSDQVTAVNYLLAIAELKMAVDKATTNSTPIVTAAGNDQADIDRSPFFPAYFAKDNDLVLAVGSVDTIGGRIVRTEYSNYGKNIVTLAANGDTPFSFFKKAEGTSFAAPRVAVWVALMRRLISEDVKLRRIGLFGIPDSSDLTEEPALNIPERYRRKYFLTELAKFKMAGSRSLPTGIYKMDNR